MPKQGEIETNGVVSTRPRVAVLISPILSGEPHIPESRDDFRSKGRQRILTEMLDQNLGATLVSRLRCGSLVGTTSER